MEPSLKDYLETLLAERSDRLMGGTIKHFGSDLCPSDLCYKEVLPANHMPQQPQAVAPAKCASPGQTSAAPQDNGACQQPSAVPAYQSCTAEAYQNYAFNALKNLANMFNNVDPQAASTPNAACNEPAQPAGCPDLQSLQQTEQNTAIMPSQQAPAACPATMMSAGQTEVMQPMEVMQVNLLISQQLERMEHMLREMYITNQELFKSIIIYCREHTED